MRRNDVQLKLLHEAGKAGSLALRQVQHVARERRRVDDRVLEGAFEAAADQPRVEGVVAVLDEHGRVGEVEEGAPSVLELGRPDEHRAVDLVAPARVRVDRRPAVDQGVEEREGAGELEALRAYLQHQERRISRRLDVQGDEVRLFEPRVRPDVRRVDGNLLPGHGLGGASRLEVKRLPAHRATARARRAQSISSRSSARSSSTATA